MKLGFLISSFILMAQVSWANCIQMQEKYASGLLCNGNSVYVVDNQGQPRKGQAQNIKDQQITVYFNTDGSRSSVVRSPSEVSRDVGCVSNVCPGQEVILQDAQKQYQQGRVQSGFANGQLLIEYKNSANQKSEIFLNKEQILNKVWSQNDLNNGQTVYFQKTDTTGAIGSIQLLTSSVALIRYYEQGVSYQVFRNLKDIFKEIPCIQWACQNNTVDFRGQNGEVLQGRIKNLFSNNKVLISYFKNGTSYEVWKDFSQVARAGATTPSNGMSAEQVLAAQLKLIAQFPVVIYINKANRGPYSQNILVFENRRLIFRDKVSTGRENLEHPPGKDANGNSLPSYYSSTPTGFFTPTWLSKDHQSNQWDSHMPYAIFFKDGFAMHQSYSDGALGRRGSGGCVRMSSKLSPQLFDLVEKYGQKQIPQFSEEGFLKSNGSGAALWRSALGYKVLIIVEDNATANPDIITALLR
ncbi:MAG: L,D-transpeptidase [Pseudobdellovibrionaceae bacterium]